MKAHPTYEILEEIGQGSSATVYRARDLALKRYVAIKELHDKFQSDQQQMQQFWQEAQFLANLNHDNIVQIYGLDKERGWIIMELMEGGLDDKLREGPLPPDLVRSVLQQTLRALQALHSQRKLHGAIKPGNLLINDQGRVKLSDSAGVPLGGVFRKPTGSAKYLAPELLKPEFGEVTVAVDLYCLGFTALELLKGPSFDSLFKGAGPDAIDPEMAWLRWHSSEHEKLPPVRELVPRIPEDLARVIDRLLQKPVDQRYKSAEEVLKDLEDRPIILVEPPRPSSLQPKTKSPTATLTPLPPTSTPPASPGGWKKPKEPRKPEKERTGAKPWSRVWLNEKLSKPYILFPLLALILIPTLIFFFWDEFSDQGQTLAVHINSVPTGASIFLDGKAQEQTTDAQLNLKPGKYQLKVELKEHKVIEKELVIAENSHGPFHFHLQKIPPPPSLRQVNIKTIPIGATVFLNGDKQKSKTPAELSLKPGKYKLELTLPDYQTRSETLEVAAGKEPLVKEYTLDPVPPALEIVRIKTTPPDAELFLDGKRLPASADGKYKIAPGEHELEARRDETHEPSGKKTIVIKKDQPDQEIVLELSPSTGTIPIAFKGDTKNVKFFIDDQLTSLAKDGKYQLPVGIHTFKVKYKEDQFIRTVTIKKGENPVEMFDLTPPLEIVTIKTDPEGAKIIINGKEAKPLPNNKNKFEVPVGVHDVQVVLDEAHEKVNKTITIVKGEKDQKFNFILPAVLFDLAIKSDPIGAEVYVDKVREPIKTPGKLTLKPGKHTLTLKSEGFKDFTKEIEIVAGKKPDEIVARLIPLDTKKFALLVSVGNPTKELPDFLHAASDIDSLADTLRAGGFKNGQIVVLKSSPQNGPTADIIRQELAKITRQATNVDQMVVVLIGHQVQFNGDQETYFCPKNSQLNQKATLLPMKDIYDALTGCKAQMKLLVRDTWRYSWYTEIMPPPGVKINQSRSAEKVPPGVIMLSSCQPGQQGYPHDPYRHGAFTYFLLRALQGDADTDKDKNISLDEAFQYVNTHLPGFTQEKYKINQRADLENANALLKSKLTVINPGLELLNKGRNQLLERNYNQAVQTLGKAALELRGMAAIYNLQAEANENLGNPDQMLKAIENALTANPSCATAYSLKGNAHFHLNQFKEALESFDKAIELDPQYDPEYTSRGIIYQLKGQFPQAVEEYKKALRFKPDSVLALQNRGHSYVKMKDLKGAIKDYSDALTLEPNNAELYNYRGLAHRQNDNLTGAIDDYTDAIKYDPKNLAYPLNRGIAYLQQKSKESYEKALKDFTRVIDDPATDKEANLYRQRAYQNRITTWKMLGKKGNADDDQKKLNELNEKIKANGSQ